MVLCTKAHDVESGGSVGEKHVVQRAIAFVLVTEIKVIGVVVERYFGSGILCRGYNLVERDGCPHGFSFGPVVSVGCQTQHNLVVRNVLGCPVGSLFHPALGADGTRLAG